MTAPTVEGQLIDLKVFYFARQLGTVGAALGWPAEAADCPRLADVLAPLPADDPLRVQICRAYSEGYSSRTRRQAATS